MDARIRVKGIINIVVKDANGKVKEKRTIRNKIVNAGLAAMAGLLLTDVSVDDFDYIAVGTGIDAAAAGDTALGTEITDSGLERAAGTGTRETTTVANDTAQLTKTFTVTGTKAVTEAGILNAPAAGTLLARQVFSAINVVSGDSLQINWQIVFSEA
jgi:uncharacterized membrane protein